MPKKEKKQKKELPGTYIVFSEDHCESLWEMIISSIYNLEDELKIVKEHLPSHSETVTTMEMKLDDRKLVARSFARDVLKPLTGVENIFE